MLGYRSFFTVATGATGAAREIPRQVAQQLECWLRAKGYDCDALAAGMIGELADGVDGLLLARDDAQGQWRRTRLIERRARQRWITDVTVGVPRSGPAWVWLDIHAPDPAAGGVVNSGAAGGSVVGQPRWTSVPRLTRQLLDVLDARDGAAPLQRSPICLGPERLPELRAALADRERRGLILLAGTDERLEPRLWVSHLATVLDQTVGLAATYVLDPRATRLLAHGPQRCQAVAPWTLRAFGPGSPPGQAATHRAPRTVSFEQLSDEHRRGHTTRMLGWWARAATARASLPGPAARADQILEQGLEEMLMASLAPPPAPRRRPAPMPSCTSATPAHDSRVALAACPARATDRERAGDDTEGGAGSGVARQMAELGEHLRRLRAERDELNQRLEDEQLAHADTVDERLRADERVRHLRRLLAEGDRVAEAFTEPEREPRPTGYGELLTEMDHLKHVRFTGSVETVIGLEDHDPLFTWGAKIWDVVCALDDYAKASLEGRCDRDVDGYLRHLPEGCRGYSAHRHGRDESEYVRQNEHFRRARVLPVPDSVSAAGEIFMGAHFKIAQSGQISPRLYYHDDTTHSGMIYVGYIGPHLPTKRTN